MATFRERYVPPAQVYGWVSTPVRLCTDPDCGDPHWVPGFAEEFRCDACGMVTLYVPPETMNGRGTVPREDHERHHANFGCHVWSGEECA